MSSERPTFDPDDLPDEKSLKDEAEMELAHVEGGISPHFIARLRELMKRKRKESEVKDDE